MFRLICLFAGLTLCLPLVSQIDFDSYKTLKCSGEIPSEFLMDFSDYLAATFAEMSEEMEDDKEDVSATLERTAMGVAMTHHLLFMKGQILFGDPVTTYLNQVKDVLLKDDPELAETVDVFTMRTSAVNAFTTAQGDIFITVGLLARMQSEAELAFTISHEIAHYEAGHTYDRIRTSSEYDGLKRAREQLTYDDVIRVKMQRSREH